MYVCMHGHVHAHASIPNRVCLTKACMDVLRLKKTKLGIFFPLVVYLFQFFKFTSVCYYNGHAYTGLVDKHFILHILPQVEYVGPRLATLLRLQGHEKCEHEKR